MYSIKIKSVAGENANSDEEPILRYVLYARKPSEDEENIRDIVAFPKNGNGVDLMMNSPSEVDQVQLDEAHLEVVEED